MDISRRNVPDAAVLAGDARRLDLPAASVGACVSNLPFGQQYGVPGEREPWLAAVLAEMTRVTRPAWGGLSCWPRSYRAARFRLS